MYRPNLITNDGIIDHHQKSHRAYKVTFPKINLKLKKAQVGRNRFPNDKDIQHLFIYKLLKYNNIRFKY